ncbi:unnamed protein product [Prunus armeniaca]
MVLKLDMSKAYDRVEWTFIEAMLKRLGFTEGWVELIMDCISTVTYYVQGRGVASGLIVSSRGLLCFSPNTDPVMKQLIADMLGVPIVTCHERYLGLPTLAQRSKSRMFNHVREQVWRKLNTWDTKLLSTAGKEVLIKEVGQALPTYTMGRKLCKPKCRGGLEFRHFEAFNKAMVAKQAWRILENPTSLVAKILKARYFPDYDFMQASLGSSPSLIWKSILWGREVIEGGLLWRVGNGVSIRVLQDR